MTLIFDRRDALTEGAQMHAIVIGVGRFPYINTISRPNRKACPDSALAVIDFLLAHRDDFTAPLATIECLLSDPRVDQPGAETCSRTDHDPRETVAVDRGMHMSVSKACDNWLDRCRKGDVLFFYGASHGVASESETALLVCEDYKVNPHKKSHGLLSVDSIARAAHVMREASASWVFLDACQEVSEDLQKLVKEVKPVTPAEMDFDELRKSNVKSVSAVGSQFGGKAYADAAGGVAYFTQALLAGLTGCCVEQDGDEWFVSGYSLSDRIEDIADILYDNAEPLRTSRLGGDSGRGYRLMRAANPRAPVAVSTALEIRMARAQSAEIVTRGSSRDVVATRGDNALVWRCCVPLAIPELQAEVVLDAGPPLIHPFILHPFGIKVKLP